MLISDAEANSCERPRSRARLSPLAHPPSPQDTWQAFGQTFTLPYPRSSGSNDFVVRARGPSNAACHRPGTFRVTFHPPSMLIVLAASFGDSPSRRVPLQVPLEGVTSPVVLQSKDFGYVDARDGHNSFQLMCDDGTNASGIAPYDGASNLPRAFLVPSSCLPGAFR